MSKYFVRNYQRLFSWVGLGLVNKAENRRARRSNDVVSCLYILLSLLLLVQQYFHMAGDQMANLNSSLDWMVWLSFFFSYAALITIVNNTLRFLKENWLLPVILLSGAFLLVQHNDTAADVLSYRHLLAIIVFMPSLGFLVRFFFDGRLWTTLVATIIIVVFFGLLVVGIDPAINSPTDGIWWALATVTTVGYGDVVPVSLAGRLVGAILVFVGLGLFVVITANFLNLMLRNETLKAPQSDVMRAELDALTRNQQAILERIEEIQKTIKKK